MKKILSLMMLALMSVGTAWADSEGETVSAAITSECGYATFCSNKNLDFSGVKGLTAYIVTSTEYIAHLKKVTKVPAGTGVVLEREEGEVKTSYDIPVIDTADPIEGNLLIAAIVDHIAEEGDYVLAYKSDVRAFFPAEPDLRIPAGKAYLHFNSDARAFLLFASETNGISTSLMNNEQRINDNAVYNLRGQRVSQPTKGLYIINGKKVVVK